MPNYDDEQMVAAVEAGIQAAHRDRQRRNALIFDERLRSVINLAVYNVLKNDPERRKVANAAVETALKDAERRKAEQQDAERRQLLDTYKYGCAAYLAIAVAFAVTMVFPFSLLITLPLMLYYMLRSKGGAS